MTEGRSASNNIIRCVMKQFHEKEIVTIIQNNKISEIISDMALRSWCDKRDRYITGLVAKLLTYYFVWIEVYYFIKWYYAIYRLYPFDKHSTLLPNWANTLWIYLFYAVLLLLCWAVSSRKNFNDHPFLSSGPQVLCRTSKAIINLLKYSRLVQNGAKA